MARVPEAEVMSEEAAVSAYDSAASQKHLDAIDNTLVEQALSLAPAARKLRGLLADLGCGSGRITLKIAGRCPELCALGVDRSRAMLCLARRAAAEQDLARRAFFLRGNAACLPFPARTFDFVLCNSVLHHLASPLEALQEMARITKPGGTLLLRDLRRPNRLSFPLHVRWHGRKYSGVMRKLFEDSVRAAYTREELAELLQACGMPQARIFLHHGSHLGFVHRAEAKLSRQV